MMLPPAARLRPEIVARLTGAVRFLGDTPAPNILHAAVLRSPHPFARIRAIDTHAARALPGVRAVLTAADLPHAPLMGVRVKDQPVLAIDTVRFVGDAVAVVAAETIAQARAACAAIVVTYDVLPPVTCPEAALAADATALHGTSNLCHSAFFTRGDIEDAFAQAAHVVDLTIDTPRQMHVALECEGGVASFDEEGRLTIHSQSQHPHGIQHLVAQVLEWPADRIDVVGSPMGGGFGGKEDAHVQPLLALAAARTGRAVRMAWDRAENVAVGVKRHPFRIRIRIGCDAQGRILAQDVDTLADTGAYASLGPEVLDTAHEVTQGPYAIPNVRIRSRLAYTNNGIAGAFRGFGALQMQVALELTIDRLAAAAGLPPLVLRRRNLVATDAPGPLGSAVLARPEMPAVLDALEQHPPLSPDAAHTITGHGVAFAQKGEGFSAGGPNGAEGRLMLTAQGHIALACGLTEMGQGAHEAALAALATTFGIDRADVAVSLGDTRTGPDAGPTAASRGAQITVRLIRAGRDALDRLVREAAAQHLGVPAEACGIGPGGVYVLHARRNRPDVTFADLARHAGPLGVDVSIPGLGPLASGSAAHAVMTTCGASADVAIDAGTGMVTVRRVDIVPACGAILSPDAFRGQVEGSVVMALGFALLEDLPCIEGRYAHDNLDGYLVPTIADAPDVGIVPVALDADDPVGLRGIGEIAMNAAAAAIVNAVTDALGVAPARLPVSPEWVLDRLACGKAA